MLRDGTRPRSPRSAGPRVGEDIGARHHRGHPWRSLGGTGLVDVENPVPGAPRFESAPHLDGAVTFAFEVDDRPMGVDPDSQPCRRAVGSQTDGDLALAQAQFLVERSGGSEGAGLKPYPDPPEFQQPGVGIPRVGLGHVEEQVAGGIDAEVESEIAVAQGDSRAPVVRAGSGPDHVLFRDRVGGGE